MRALKLKLNAIIHKAGYFSEILVLDETENTLKLKLVINKNCFVQLYFNIKKSLKNYVLILNGQRIYGRDCLGGQWHTHPWEAPEKHKLSSEVSLLDFLFEVYAQLKERNLL